MNEKFRKYTNNYWLGLAIGLVLLVAGILLVPHARGEEGYNLVLALPMCLFLLTGVFLLYRSAKALILSLITGSAFTPAVKPKEYTGKNMPNTILLAAWRDEDDEDYGIVPVGIEMVYLENPKGQRRYLENTREYFYLNIREVDGDKIKNLILPDTVYLDPRKYVIPLTMPANSAYWRPIPNPWEKVSIFALIGVILIEFIAGVVWG